MIRKCLSIAALIMLVLGANTQSVTAQSGADAALEKVKNDVGRRGTGEKAKVVVKMKDGTTRKGSISQAGGESFDMADSKTKQPTTIAYRDVTQVKKQGWSSGAKIALGVVIGVAAAAAVLAIAVKNADFPDIRVFP